HPDAGTAGITHGVVFLPDIGKVDVTDVVGKIEPDQETPVPDGQVTRHSAPIPSAMRASIILCECGVAMARKSSKYSAIRPDPPSDMHLLEKWITITRKLRGKAAFVMIDRAFTSVL